MSISGEDQVGHFKKMAENIPDKRTQAASGVQSRSETELCGCGYQEGCLEAAAKPMRDIEVRGRVSAKASLRDL